MREQCEARGIPTPLSDAVCMSMALDPAKRFASAEALGRATRAAYDLSRPVRPPAPAPVRTPDSETVLASQGLQKPAGLPRPAASTAMRSALSRSGVSGAHLEYARLLLAACVLCRKSLCRLSPHGSKPKLPDVASHNRVFFLCRWPYGAYAFCAVRQASSSSAIRTARQLSRQETRETLAQGIGCAAPMHDRHSRGCQCDRRRRYLRYLKEKGPIGALCSCT